jgi:hypothetical protein
MNGERIKSDSSPRCQALSFGKVFTEDPLYSGVCLAEVVILL